MTEWNRPNLRDAAAGTITVEQAKNHVGRAPDIPRTVNRDRGWFKTRHSLAIDVRKRMRGQVAPDGDRSRAWQVRR